LFPQLTNKNNPKVMVSTTLFNFILKNLVFTKLGILT